MIKLTLTALWLSLTFNCLAQIKFETGYFINNKSEKIVCLIKNIDWKNNPDEFAYKLTEDAAVQTGRKVDVAEFGVANSLKYKRFKVDIERSSEKLDRLSNTVAPEFTSEDLFLKVLVEGKATLYVFEMQDITKFFFSTAKVKPTQLIFKSYTGNGNSIAENNTFREQLWINLKCSTNDLKRIEKIRYQQHELINFFTAYNTCEKSTSTNFEATNRKGWVHLSVRAGPNLAGLDVQNSLTGFNHHFDSKIALRLGVEGEFVFAFNKNKWSVIVEPSYQSYKSRAKGNSAITIDYKFIELSAGLRHYFFLNDDSKLFLNAGLLQDFPLSSSFRPDRYNNLNTKSVLSASFGVGYKYKNKFSVELRSLLNRNILNWYIYYDSQFKNTGLIFGYTIF